ncbi:MAG: hypothetical protein ACR2N1_10075 [Rubripirellula sp.]
MARSQMETAIAVPADGNRYAATWRRITFSSNHILAALVILLVQSNLFAQKAPLSPEKLRSAADAIVVGSITNLQSRSEPSRLETGFGNFDWLVTLTVNVSDIEVGDVPANTIDILCIRTGSRKSLTEQVGLTGHSPIPDIGTTARFYLTYTDDAWQVLMPNGIMPVGTTGEVATSDIPEAKQVTELSAGFTYVLPIELWGVLAVASVFATFVYLKRKRSKRHAA